MGEKGTDKRDKRIVSLLPSITEILVELGVSSMIVGITHECDYPADAIKNASVVTTSEISPHKMSQEEIHIKVCGSLTNGNSLYGLNGEALRSLAPDIIFTQSLCDICAVSYPVVVKSCAKLFGGSIIGSNEIGNGPMVVSMEPTSLCDVLDTFHVAAKALDQLDNCDSGEVNANSEGKNYARCKEVTTRIDTGLDRIRSVVKSFSDRRQNHSKPLVAFLEWHTPLFSGGHWIPDMLETAGAFSAMGISGKPSKVVTDEEFEELDPDYILIGPCGMNLERSIRDTLAMYKARPMWRELKAVKQNRVFALDGDSYYARPGPRLLQGTGIMAACIHGDELAKELGEDLAPSSGYQRITIDMYDK